MSHVNYTEEAYVDLSGIKDYLKGLLPSFKRNDVLNDAKATLDILKNHTLPPYKSAVDERVFQTLKSAWCKDTNTYLMGQLRGQRGNYIEIVYRALQTLPAKLEWLEQNVAAEDSNEISKFGLTYRSTSVIRALEGMSFTVSYARKLLLWTYHQELIANGGGDIPAPLNAVEQKKLNDGLTMFARYLQIFLHTTEEFVSAIESAPEITLDLKNIDAAVQVHGRDIVDPMRFGFINHRYNPIYHVRLAIAEWQTAKYHEAVEEQKSLELRLMHLKKQRSGQQDAALEKMIDVQEKRMLVITNEIIEMERDAGMRE